jgi:carbon monoxide dehydrogenase subunit G
MVSIKASRSVSSSVDRVWEVVSDVDRDTEYWKGISSISNVRKEENLVERTVKVGFLGNGGYQIIKLNPKTSIELVMTKGPLKGSRRMKLTSDHDGKTQLEVAWDFQFSQVPIFARPFVKSQIEGATHEALEKIAQAAEQHPLKVHE